MLSKSFKLLSSSSSSSSIILKSSSIQKLYKHIPSKSLAAELNKKEFSAYLYNKKKGTKIEKIYVPEPIDPIECKNFKNSFRYVGSLVMMRNPIVAKPLEKWEEDYITMKAEEMSAKARDENFESEVDETEDIEPNEEKNNESSDSDDKIKKIEKEKLSSASLNKVPFYEHADMKPTNLTTSFDVANDRKSIYRKLWNTLYLIVKKNRKDHPWQFSQGGIDKGESIRDCAEREFEEECGEDVVYYTPANHPISYQQYALPADIQKKTDTYGTRVFYIPSYYMEGQVQIDGKEIVDYAWVTLEELKEYVTPEVYAKYQKFLID